MLQSSPLTATLSAEARRELERTAVQKTLGPGDVLWRKGERAHHLGIVLAGRVALSRPGVSKDNLFEVVKEGDVLGDVGFALASTYSSTVWCPRRARVALLPAIRVRRLLEEEPKAVSALAIQLATRVSRLLSRIEVLSALSVDKRLARTLLTLAEQLGQPFPGGTFIPVKLRRSDLASLSATTLETTSRKMAEWERRGYLATQPAGLLLREISALEQLAGD